MFLGICVFGGISHAGTYGYVTKEYGDDMYLDCYISCSSSKGVAKTKGNTKGTYNRASIVIYNSSGVSLGNSTKYSVLGEAVASKTATLKVYSARSYHSLLYVLDNTHVYPLYQQVIMNEDRY